MRSRLALLSLLLAGGASAAAPEFSLTDLSGAAVRSAGLRGRPVLLEFWATWCDSCADSIPFYRGLDERFRSKGLRVVGVAEESSAEEIARFAERNRMSYRILLDRGRRAFRAFGLRALPSAVLLDADGNVVQRWTGFDARAAAEIEKAVSATQLSMICDEKHPAGR